MYVCVAKDNLRVNALLNNRLRGQTVNKEARLSARFFFLFGCVRHVLTCAFLVLYLLLVFKSSLRVKARRFSLEHFFKFFSRFFFLKNIFISIQMNNNNKSVLQRT